MFSLIKDHITGLYMLGTEHNSIALEYKDIDKLRFQLNSMYPKGSMVVIKDRRTLKDRRAYIGDRRYLKVGNSDRRNNPSEVQNRRKKLNNRRQNQGRRVIPF